MAHIALVNPNDAKCYTFSRSHRKALPLGQAYVAAAALRAGHDVSVLDASAESLDEDTVVQRVAALRPDIVGIGGTTPLYSQMVSLSRRVKAELPDSTVILGGPHVSALPAQSLRSSGADMVCVGEGEWFITSLLNGPTPPMGLNDCPIPARHLYDHSKYNDPARGIESRQTGAMFSRGCPGRCVFCSAAKTKVRWRDLDNVLAELHQIQDAGIPNLFVMDDTYTNHKRRVLDLSRRIVDEGIRLNISVQLRLDQIDKDICDAMYASGVRYVGPGIESGNERIMRAIGKGPRETKDHIREKVALLHQYDWMIRCSYVFGMIGETEDDILETIAFAKELAADESAFSILTPYPGSPLWDIALKQGKVSEDMDFDRFLYYHTVGCNLSEVPTERLLELHELAYRETLHEE